MATLASGVWQGTLWPSGAPQGAPPQTLRYPPRTMAPMRQIKGRSVRRQ